MDDRSRAVLTFGRSTAPGTTTPADDHSSSSSRAGGHECVTPALPLERAHASFEDYARVVIDTLDRREDELFDDRWGPRCQRAEVEALMEH